MILKPLPRPRRLQPCFESATSTWHFTPAQLSWLFPRTTKRRSRSAPRANRLIIPSSECIKHVGA